MRRVVGLRTIVTSGSVAVAGDVLEPNVWVWPAPDAQGLDVRGASAVDLSVGLHEDIRARTVYFVINRDAAPLTGNYVIRAGGTTSTYDATAGAPADVDELLAGWAAAVLADLGPVGANVLSSVDVVRWATTEGEETNAIKVVGAIGSQVGHTTFALGAATAAPEGAALHIWREPTECVMDVLFKPESENTTARHQATVGITGCRRGWKASPSGVGISINALGYDERWQVPSRAEVWPHLRGASSSDDVIPIAGSGSGVYKTSWLVYAGVSRPLE